METLLFVSRRETLNFLRNGLISIIKIIIIYFIHRLEKCISLVDYEKNRNNNINIASIIEFVPEFKEKIDNSKSQIVKLDVSS